MNIWLENIGKNYGDTWVFRSVNHVFKSGGNTVILGANGSGKSTLLKIISGYGIPTEGKVEYENIEPEHIFKNVAMAAPYLELYQDLSLIELVNFQRKFKLFHDVINHQSIEALFQLKGVRDQKIKSFSSGMCQRVKLGLAIFSDVPILLLDEPSSYLDDEGIEWYQKLIEKYTEEKTVIVCSNANKIEHEFCDLTLDIKDFKIQK